MMYTKRNAFEELLNIVIENGDSLTDNGDKIVTILNKELAALDHKNDMAKKRAAEKRAKGDVIREEIAGMLSEEPLTIADILNTLNADESQEKVFTPSMVVARMTQLCNEGRAKRVALKADGRKLTGYIAK